MVDFACPVTELRMCMYSDYNHDELPTKQYLLLPMVEELFVAMASDKEFSELNEYISPMCLYCTSYYVCR